MDDNNAMALRVLQLIAQRADGDGREYITVGDLIWAIQELQYPRDDGTEVALGGEPGASTGASE